MEGATGLDEETLAHCEHTLEFMTTCLIVNEPPQFLHILGMVFHLLNRVFGLSKAAETSDSTICSPEVKRELRITANGRRLMICC